jgi:hypothetical protein
MPPGQSSTWSWSLSSSIWILSGTTPTCTSRTASLLSSICCGPIHRSSWLWRSRRVSWPKRLIHVRNFLAAASHAAKSVDLCLRDGDWLCFTRRKPSWTTKHDAFHPAPGWYICTSRCGIWHKQCLNYYAIYGIRSRDKTVTPLKYFYSSIAILLCGDEPW